MLEPRNDVPAVFHITHWKAGSQWIYKILHQCVRERIVHPKLPNNTQFLGAPVAPGTVYPTLYIEKPDFDRVAKPLAWKKFIVIRDLRDTLISGYFSLKISHPIISDWIESFRAELQSLDTEAGILRVMDEWLPDSARIQQSWITAGEEILRYEDLLHDDFEILTRVVIDDCRLPVTRERLGEIVAANRFEVLTAGRRRGEEDLGAHERKGMPGDWRNHFTPRITEVFKRRYADLLVATGYERGTHW
jgi:lipopolysaccharide transport system ATP-binding protein